MQNVSGVRKIVFLWIQIHRGLKASWSEEGQGTRGTSMCGEEGRRTQSSQKRRRTLKDCCLSRQLSDIFQKEEKAGQQSSHPLRIQSNELWEKVMGFDQEEVILAFSFGERMIVRWEWGVRKWLSTVSG